MTTKSRRAAALNRAHQLELAEGHMAAVGATPSGRVIAEDIYCLLCQSLFGRYSRSNMIPSWSEWIERAGEVPSGRPPGPVCDSVRRAARIIAPIPETAQSGMKTTERRWQPTVKLGGTSVADQQAL